MNIENSFTCTRAIAALDRVLNPEEEILWREHVSSCPNCLAKVESSVRDFSEVEFARQLNSDELDAELDIKNSFSTTDFLVEFLEPASNPKFLGSIGNYDVVSVIGRGGMGIVLKAYDRELKRFVAVKALSPHLASQPLARKRFAREAQAAAAVVHLNVIPIYQVQPNGRLPFLVMPLVGGESVADRMQREGSLGLPEALRIGIQTVAGLSAAHEQGLVHRDVKPSNILLEKGVERAVLTDFGLARAVDDISLTRTNAITGTPEYMSPEAARGEPVDARSDLFSFGCVLYAMVSGVSPFRADSTMASLRQVSECSPQPLASLCPHLPTWFIVLVERLLAKQPSLRFSTALEVQSLLEQGLSHLQKPSEAAAPAIERVEGESSPCPATRSKSSSRFGVITMILLALSVGGWAWMQVLGGMNSIPDIAGVWEGDGWGTVTLRQASPGNFVGEYTDVYQSATSPNNDRSKLRSGTPGVGITSSDNTLSRTSLGSIHLLWSRDSQKFHGTWSQGMLRFGDISVRAEGNELRGAFTANEKSQIYDAAKDRVSDLHWKRKDTSVASQTTRSALTPNDAWRQFWNGSQESRSGTGKTGMQIPIQGITLKDADPDETQMQLEALRDLFALPRFKVIKVPNANQLIVAVDSRSDQNIADPSDNMVVKPDNIWDFLVDFGAIVESDAYHQKAPMSAQQKAGLEKLRRSLIEKMKRPVDLHGRISSWDRVHSKRTDLLQQSALAPAIQNMIDAASTDELAKAKLELFVAEENLRVDFANFEKTSPIKLLLKERYELCLDAISTTILEDESSKAHLRKRLTANQAAIDWERTRLNRGEVESSDTSNSTYLPRLNRSETIPSGDLDAQSANIILRQYMTNAKDMQKRLQGLFELFAVPGEPLEIVLKQSLSVKRGLRGDVAKLASELLDSEFDLQPPPHDEAGRVQTALLSIDRWQRRLLLLKKLHQIVDQADRPTDATSGDLLRLKEFKSGVVPGSSSAPVPLKNLEAHATISRMNRVCNLLGIDDVKAVAAAGQTKLIALDPSVQSGAITDWIHLIDRLEAETIPSQEERLIISALRWNVLRYLHDVVRSSLQVPLSTAYDEMLSEARSFAADRYSKTNVETARQALPPFRTLRNVKAQDAILAIKNIQTMFGITAELPVCNNQIVTFAFQEHGLADFQMLVCDLEDFQPADNRLTNVDYVARCKPVLKLLAMLEKLLNSDSPTTDFPNAQFNTATSRLEANPKQTRTNGLSVDSANELAKLQHEYDNLLLKYGRAHPKVIEVGNRIGALSERILKPSDEPFAMTANSLKSKVKDLNDETRYVDASAVPPDTKRLLNIRTILEVPECDTEQLAKQLRFVLRTLEVVHSKIVIEPDPIAPRTRMRAELPPETESLVLAWIEYSTLAIDADGAIKGDDGSSHAAKGILREAFAKLELSKSPVHIGPKDLSYTIKSIDEKIAKLEKRLTERDVYESIDGGEVGNDADNEQILQATGFKNGKTREWARRILIGIRRDVAQWERDLARVEHAQHMNAISKRENSSTSSAGLLLGVDLSNKDLSKLNLRGNYMAFGGTNFDGANLQESSLVGQCAFQSATFRKATLTQAKLYGGNHAFQQADFTECKAELASITVDRDGFHHAILQDADFTGTTFIFKTGSFQATNCFRTKFDRAVFGGSESRGVFDNCLLTGASFLGSDLISLNADNLLKCPFDSSNPPKYNSDTRFPLDFDPIKAGWQKVDPNSSQTIAR